MTTLASIIVSIAEEMRTASERGAVANYIPPLARVDLNRFGMAVVGMDGETHTVGDAAVPFSVQSVSKVFSLSMALNAMGEELWGRVRQEPSGSAFNSIIQLENEHGIPRNPFINAGAIVIADILVSRYGRENARTRLLDFLRPLVDDPASIDIDTDVARQERETGFRNMALANYMRTFGNIRNVVEDTLDFYFHQCALTMNCQQLAQVGTYLMTGGLNPLTGERVMSERNAQTILALMMMCGHYDGSGAFAIRVGLPGKSGVGGGILAIAPGVASIAVWSPGLNAQGNSLLGTRALERLVQHTGWSVFRASPWVVNPT
ncbi:glutaminase [Gluconobacter kondonii]|uniref:Glutaminase n=1 Tax=Gluconobacter kondonii TaxID=941463 RepID=A0ABQ5WMK6_9PROT|nr:glutaminase [Gluconobacter kondonii]MBS1066264.1 glutaminase [Gluconobacter kondonii]MBS1081041.1 glutaminase [Gluconobacter kondonii]MBS1081893.1 glutaminase [Gluconobacter kondonii]MCP1235320.1 glutaminase [Gluconobacter kondonii]GBR29355.1 glutaminase [Gluconobacter kondonii NBRC 3266]